MEHDAGSTGWQPLGAVTRRTATAGRSSNEEAFLRLALTHAAVMAGDAMVTVALAKSVFFSTGINGARGRVLLSLLLTMAPFAVVAPLLGPAIDKSRGGRRLMVILSAAGRCLTCLYMARVVNNLLLFLPAALVLLILSKAHAIAKSALVPATVDSPGDLVKAGGRLAVLAAIAGAGAGGIAALLNLVGPTLVLRVAAGVYACGAILALRTRPAPPAQLDPADHIDEAARSRGVSLAAIAMATLRGIAGFLTFAVAFSFRRAHEPAWWYGLVLMGAVLGGFLGNLAGPSLRTRLKEERILVLALGGVATAGLLVGLSGSRLAIVLVAFAVGVGDGIGQLAFDAIVQRDGSEGSRARSFARFEASFQLTWVAAAVIPVALPIATWLAAIMVGLVAASSAIYVLVGRRLVAQVGRAELPPGDGEPTLPLAPMPDSTPMLDATLMLGPSPDPTDRPPYDGGVRWSEAESPPLREPAGPVDLPPPTDDGSLPRRNPHRANPTR